MRPIAAHVKLTLDCALVVFSGSSISPSFLSLERRGPTPRLLTTSAESSRSSRASSSGSTCQSHAATSPVLLDRGLTLLLACTPNRSQTNILDPLKMTSTSFNLTPALKARATFPLGFRDLATQKLSPTMPTNSPWAFFNSVPDTPQIHFGAWGLWSTFADYSKLLIHLLQIAPGSDVKPEVKPILGEVGWKSLFEGGLTAESKEALELNRSKKIPVPGTNWSTALLVNEVDWEGRRRAGTGACASTLLFRSRRYRTDVIVLSFHRGRHGPHPLLDRSHFEDRREYNCVGTCCFVAPTRLTPLPQPSTSSASPEPSSSPRTISSSSHS